MEPVPETERMEEFRPSPLPTLYPQFVSTADLEVLKKPQATRRSTDPIPSSHSASASSWLSYTSPAMPYRPRTASPLSGTHSRSHSTSGLAPAMSRARSMPGVNGSGHILYSPQLRPASPSSPSRSRTPRKPADEGFPLTSPVRTSVLDHDRQPSDRSTSPGLTSSASMSRLRRTSSPFRNPPISTASSSVMPSTPSSTASSPLYRAYDSNSHNGYLSSMPSTPTSARSRSPSISSLETIPDSPDAEEAALEAERQAQLLAAAEAAEGSDSSTDSKGRSSLDVPARGRTLSYAPRDKRKRWSVCGAERRGDLDLETIWED